MLSVVIPTQNMSSYLRPLLESFRSSGCDAFVSEYIVVNDGSTDQTSEVLRGLSLDTTWKTKLKVVENQEGKGRFKVRNQGALAANEDLLFFCDTRVLLPPVAGENLEQLLKAHRFLMGMPYIDTAKSVFSLYWDRSHRWIYRKYFRDVKDGFYLNSENYEQYAKGTGLLIVDKEVFLKACDSFGSEGLLSDDTLLMKEIVRTNPIFVIEKFSFEWEPRQSCGEFLWRLIDRGPGFVEYNFFYQRNRFFYAAVCAGAFGVFVVTLAVLSGGSFLSGIFVLLGLGAGSVLLMTRRIDEVIKLVPLHLLVLCSFSMGVVYGLCYHVFTRRQRPL